MFTNHNEALSALIPFVVDSANPLWDGGLLLIEKQDDGTYLVELTGFYYEAEADKGVRQSVEKERAIVFSETHKAVYDYVQSYYDHLNPAIQWNRLIVEVDSKGQYIPHYELDGEEVSPNAPSEPEVITAAYLCENLRNCLAYNAPDSYEWVWEVLEREKWGDGTPSIGGNFFYSMYADKSDPQPLEPGEYIYMYNVSERLLNEFFYEQTKNWSRIRLEFSKDGKAKYYLLEQDYY